MSANYSAPPSDGGTARTKIAPVLLTPEQTARTLNIGRSKVYELILSGALASVGIGGSRRVRTTAIEEFLDKLANG